MRAQPCLDLSGATSPPKPLDLARAGEAKPFKSCTAKPVDLLVMTQANAPQIFWKNALRQIVILDEFFTIRCRQLSSSTTYNQAQVCAQDDATSL